MKLNPGKMFDRGKRIIETVQQFPPLLVFRRAPKPYRMVPSKSGHKTFVHFITERE